MLIVRAGTIQSSLLTVSLKFFKTSAFVQFPSNSAATKDFILAFHSKLSRRKSMEKMQKNCFLTVHAVLHNILFICLKRDFQESLHVKTFRILPKRLVLILMNSFFVCVRAVA